MKSPTHSFYRYLEAAYDHFNTVLFNNRLPACLLTVQREKNVMGYFSANRWTDSQGRIVHEIAVNPAYFARHNLMEVMQTIVHEMVHNWQHCFGKPSRNGYHNKEWAHMMDQIGLVPSSTGLPGGKRTGQKVSDYPKPGGVFEHAAKSFIIKSKGLPWVDRFTALSPSCQPRDKDLTREDERHNPEIVDGTGNETVFALLHCPIRDLFNDLVPGEQRQQAARKKMKYRYTCHHCKTNVWGKPNLKLTCGECGAVYVEHEAA